MNQANIEKFKTSKQTEKICQTIQEKKLNILPEMLQNITKQNTDNMSPKFAKKNRIQIS